MPDEQPQESEARPIAFTLHTVHTVDAWPERTELSDGFLAQPHVRHATVDGDAVTFRVGNGRAVYRLRTDLPKRGDATIADLIEGDTPARLRQRAKKFEIGGED